MPGPILTILILILVWTMTLAGCQARASDWTSIAIVLPYIWFLGVVPWRRYRARTRLDSPHNLGLQRFFEETGYRLLGMEGSPLGSQVEAVASVWLGGPRAPGEPIVPRPYTRDLAGDRLVYHHGAAESADPWGAPLGQSAWVLFLREPVRTPWSLREKDVGMRLLWTVLTLHRFSRLKPRLPEAILIEPALRARFKLYAEDGTAVDPVLTDPEIQEALLACVDLDLHVLKDRIILMDPLRRNLAAGAGGLVADLTLRGDPERQLELMAMSHLRIAGLLAQIAQRCRGRA